MVNFSTLSTVFLSLFLNNSDVVTNNSISNTTAVVEPAKVQAGVLIDDFSDEAKIYNWWDSSTDNWERKWDREKEVLVVKCKSVGKGGKYDCFGKQFDAIDFSKTPVIKVRMKFEGSEVAPKVRFDIKDYDGKIANAKPLVKTLKSGDYQEYYYNFTDRFNQSYPEAATVDPVEIVELLIFVNPGGPEFNGTITLDKVEAIPASECPKE